MGINKTFVCGNCQYFLLTSETTEVGWCVFEPDISDVITSMVNIVETHLGRTYIWRDSVPCKTFLIKPKKSIDS